MASNPLFIIPDFFLHFPNELCYGYLRFEGNGKIPLGRQGKKVCPVGCLTLVLLPKVAIAEFFWKMQRKTWYSILGLDAKPLSTKFGMLIYYCKINQRHKEGSLTFNLFTGTCQDGCQKKEKQENSPKKNVISMILPLEELERPSTWITQID